MRWDVRRRIGLEKWFQKIKCGGGKNEWDCIEKNFQYKRHEKKNSQYGVEIKVQKNNL